MLRKFFSYVARIFRERAIPVYARVDQELPIVFERALEVPIEVRVTVDFEDMVSVEGEIPVSTTLAIDTVVETEILRFGTVKIPIRASIPVSMVVPFSTRVKARAHAIPVKVQESVTVRMPTLNVPINTRIRTLVSLFPNERQ